MYVILLQGYSKGLPILMGRRMFRLLRHDHCSVTIFLLLLLAYRGNIVCIGEAKIIIWVSMVVIEDYLARVGQDVRLIKH